MTIGRVRYVDLLLLKHTLEKKIFIAILAFCILVYVYYTLLYEDRITNRGVPEITSSDSNNQKYLINTSNCRIPDVDPFGEEVRKYIRKVKYRKCSEFGLLTYIDKKDGVATLKVNSSVLPLYSTFKVQCCYSKIYRSNYQYNADNNVRYSRCTEFEDAAVITHPFIRVICKSFFTTIYSNVHATVLPIEKSSKGGRGNRYNVLLVAIDSISKLNLRRTMPKTHSYLEKHFHDMKGYNKIGDNTFPNLMAILTGENNDHLRITCKREVKMNECNIIWDTFKKFGYVTGYAEDECAISTFNFDRLGFREPPTDYYYRPYFTASEKLGRVIIYGMTYCAGPENSGERILNAIQDFVVTLKEVPSFGLFWMNSFSHENINMPSAMDEKMLEFLSGASFRSSLENTVMFFFSDHGFRFGDIRYTHTGWLEERLPYMYVYLPEKFKKDFREKYENVAVNTERLVTPYDVYCTLQEILEMGNNTYKAKKSTGCPNCHSLFKQISEDRSCKSVAIDQHWCTCMGHKKVSPKDSLVAEVAEFVVQHINRFTKTFEEGGRCSNYNLNKIVTAGMSEDYVNEKNQTVRYFLVIIETTPEAMFEATVEGSRMSDFKLLGDISRINRYKENSDCVKNAVLKKYCHCDGIFQLIKRAICLTC